MIGLTGVTGFVGKAFLAWVLVHHPDDARWFGADRLLPELGLGIEDYVTKQAAGESLWACTPGTPQQPVLQRMDAAGPFASVVTLGEFRTVALGDLLWDVDFGLACPTNKVGPIDLYLTTHHGLATSGSPT